MHSATALIILLAVTYASAAPSQPEVVSGSQPVSQPQQQQNSPVTNNSPAGQVQPVVESPVVEQPVGVHHQPQAPQQQQFYPHQPSPGYYAPAGLIQVVGAEQPVMNKPVVGPQVRNFEQYGQPESASIPANYKPFGSWGLYIGGNPADGYYTNYYKALSNTVDKQQTGEPVKPVSQTAAFSPILKQAGSSPYLGGDYYPFAYSPAELNSGARVGVDPIPPHSAVIEPSGSLSYADMYATKKVGAAYAQKEVKDVQVPSSPKGYQSRIYSYPSPVASPVVHHQPQQPHVVAYPVPVGSQIVGSQQGVEGAFAPYGIHAFTRYAVKPTVVSQDQSYHYNVHNQMPSYKQQQQYVQYHPVPQHSPLAYQPLSFYGYPLNQLHYSQGSIVPSVHNNEQPFVHHGVPMPVGSEAAGSEKSENEDKSSVNKQQQKRA